MSITIRAVVVITCFLHHPILSSSRLADCSHCRLQPWVCILYEEFIITIQLFQNLVAVYDGGCQS
ncbi:hypothetical protein LINPERPRIM_LOCUS20154 [Linum perenne]